MLYWKGLYTLNVKVEPMKYANWQFSSKIDSMKKMKRTDILTQAIKLGRIVTKNNFQIKNILH